MQGGDCSWKRGVARAALLVLPAAALPAAEFIRGDSNSDRERDISDPLFTLDFLFRGGDEPSCRAACDANDDEKLDLADPVADLAFLFLGAAPLPPPGPRPGPDPTPGLGCGFPPPDSLTCAKRGPAVDLAFRFSEVYDAVEVLRDGEPAAALPGGATAYRDRPPSGGDHSYSVRGLRAGRAGEAASCRVTGLPENQPPSLTLLAPAPGVITDAAALAVSGRVSDDSAVVRIVVDGVEAAPSPAPPVPYGFTASVPLEPGPRLVRIEAVDDFGRTAFLDLAAARRPLLPVATPSQGLALDITGSPGYGEVEAVVRPLLVGVPALVDSGVRGARLFQGSYLGVDLTVTGNRAEIPGPIGLDIAASAANGGRLALTMTVDTARLVADGASDFGFLGTDRWSAVWTGRGVSIAGRIALRPRPGGAGLEVISDGFQVAIGSSDLEVNGFLDPFGIFDSLVGFLADLFQAEIEAEVKRAVEDTANHELLPVLASALSNLRFNLNLGDVVLSTLFHDAIESGRGLSLLFDALWRGSARDPAFPRYPGSRAAFAPYPVFPLPVAARHPIDATISLSADTLNQALLELAAGGLLEADLRLDGLGSPVPLVVGTLASAIDPRLERLPGVRPDDPLGLRVRAAAAPEVRLGEGLWGRLILGEGVIWRYRRGTAEPPAAWKGFGFDDTTWERGSSGFGYSSDPAELRSVRTRLPDMAAGGYLSLYTRTRFSIPDPAALRGLFLRVYYDDGFAAYLNGVEVARVNLPGGPGTPIAFDQPALGAVEPTWRDLDLAAFRRFLRPGDNVLAVEGRNAGATSTDFVLLAELLEPLPPPAGALSSVPGQIEIAGLEVGFVADTARDGIGETGGDGARDDVELFAFSLELRLQMRLLLLRDAEGSPTIAFEVQTQDGPDPDSFPDGVVGGAAGIGISVAREAYDVDDRLLREFAEFALALFGPSLGETLEGFALPAFPVPELSFDLDRDGAPETRLDIEDATLVPVDTTGDGRADWLCILSDLRAAAP